MDEIKAKISKLLNTIKTPTPVSVIVNNSIPQTASHPTQNTLGRQESISSSISLPFQQPENELARRRADGQLMQSLRYKFIENGFKLATE